MSVSGFQEFNLLGSRFYFKRDAIATVDQPIIDLGVIETASPALNVEEVSLVDSDGGLKRTVAKAISRIEETYDITCSNLNMDNLSLLFMSKPVTAFSQAVDAQADIAHKGWKGRLLKLKDSTGAYIFGIDSIVVKAKGGGTTYTLDTDYEWVSKPRGLIRIKTGGAIDAGGTGEDLDISITPLEIKSSKRLINPQDAAGVVEGDGLLIWSSGNNTQQKVRDSRFSITPQSAAFAIDNYSNFVLRLTVISDTTSAVPAGRLLYWLGDVPSLS